jgi:beta-xylosidase
MLKHGEWYYMVLAEGGTAGPPTSHMVVAARSKKLEGPWENSPYNPIVHTKSAEEKWWSKGHATLVEGPGGKWYLVYHGYENGLYTLGRQTLLEPVVWTEDGWFKSAGADVSKPIEKPGGEAVKHGFAYSDDFSTNKMGIQWSFHEGGDADAGRYRYEQGSLVMQGKGESPKDCSPLCFVTGDPAYEVEVDMEISEGARAGLILFYNEKLYAGLGFDREHLVMHRYGEERTQGLPAGVKNRLHLRLKNDRNILSIAYSADGEKWTRFGTVMEVSGYHHNVAGGFLSLRPALYAAGKGEVRFRDFRYRALP